MDGSDYPGQSGCGCGGACESCAERREHYCKDHVRDDHKQFLVVVDSDDCTHSMRLSRKVGSHLRNMVPPSKPIQLETPNGEYPVEVSPEFVLRSGWSEFVNAHHIKEKFSILFKYGGNSRFTVQIFDSTGQDRSFSCSQAPSGIFGPVRPHAPSDHHVQNEQVVPNPGHVNSTNSGYIMFPGCCLTIAQDEKVKEITHATRSEFPLYVAAMSKSNVSLKNCCVYIPLGFMDSFREEITKDTVELQGPCRVVCVGASKHGREQIVLESGWRIFLDSHQIQENDLLIFSRTENPRQLLVRIFDPRGREKTSSCFVKRERSSSAQDMSDDSVRIVDPPPRQIIDLPSSDDDDIVREGTRARPQKKRVTRSCAKAQNMASTSSPCTKSGYGAPKSQDLASVMTEVDSEPLSSNLRPFQRPYIVAQQTALPMQVERKVQEKVQEIGSELPIFVKVMTPNNIDCVAKKGEMVFGSVYASACLPDEAQPLLLQLEGRTKQWQATLSVKSRYARRIYYGWMEFVQDNQLKVGDICLFEVSSRNSTSLKMTVHLVR